MKITVSQNISTVTSGLGTSVADCAYISQRVCPSTISSATACDCISRCRSSLGVSAWVLSNKPSSPIEIVSVGRIGAFPRSSIRAISRSTILRSSTRHSAVSGP